MPTRLFFHLRIIIFVLLMFSVTQPDALMPQAAVDSQPTISDIADQTTSLNTSTAAIPFTVNDVESSPEGLSIEGSSDNNLLVPNENILFAGDGTERTVTLVPAPDQAGSALITIWVTDEDFETSNDFFTLTVTAENTNPTISDILDQLTNEDTQAGPVDFNVNDAETNPVDLSVTASSGNTTLVPNENISLGGSGIDRTVTVNPATNQSGTALITVTVNDTDGGSASDDFLLTVSTDNDLPTISNIGDQTTNEGNQLGPIAFTVDDVETPLDDLEVTASSDNTTLVPNANILLDGSGGNRTVTITPAANQSGTAGITITVTDGDSGSASDSFNLTVTAINDPPSISDIANQSTLEDTPTSSIPFTVSDNETAAVDLVVTASSGNTTVVPNANIVLGGSGADRTLTITPATNKNGSVLITVTVDDGDGGSDSDTFTLTVTSVNDLPTILDITDKTTDEDTQIGPISFTVDDEETAAANLNLSASSSNTTLVPNSNISLGGSGKDRTVTINPAANQFGTTVITITVTDGNSASASDTFTLTVEEVNDAPTNISLSPSSIAENEAMGSTVGTLSTTDIDANETFTYSLAPGDEYNNSSFAINGDKLITSASFDYETKSSYKIRLRTDDGRGGAYEKDFTIQVTNVNEAPTGLSDPYEVNQGETLTVAAPGVLGNDSDPEGDPLTAVKTTDPQHGTLTLQANGSFTYKPSSGFAGQDSFTYKAKDSGGKESAAVQVIINVKDAASPSVEWKEPVPDGGQMDVNGETVTLRVEATDDVSIDRVRFYRWDPNSGADGSFVDIFIDDKAPYEVEFNTSVLNYRFNEIRVRAYDESNKVSFYKWIWLYRVPPTDYFFIPLVGGE